MRRYNLTRTLVKVNSSSRMDSRCGCNLCKDFEYKLKHVIWSNAFMDWNRNCDSCYPHFNTLANSVRKK